MADSTDLMARGLEIAGKLWGARAGGQELPAQKLAPEFFGLVAQFVFGMFWSRPNLDLRSRSLCTVAQLAALGKTDELQGASRRRAQPRHPARGADRGADADGVLRRRAGRRAGAERRRRRARPEGLIHARPLRSVADRRPASRLGGDRAGRVAVGARRGRALRPARRGPRPAARRARAPRRASSTTCAGSASTGTRAPTSAGPRGPYRQSERSGALRGRARRPSPGADLLYRCDCSRAEIARVASAPHPGDEGPRYPGTCRDLGMRDAGRGSARRRVRLRVPGRRRWWSTTRSRGASRQDVAATVGDFVLRRGDGVFAYQLAVVVDDLAMGVTEVVRGADLLGSTPRQVLLAELLGGTPPRYAHVPLVLARRRRAGSPSATAASRVREQRDAGVAPGRARGRRWRGSSASGRRLGALRWSPRFDRARARRPRDRPPARRRPPGGAG